MKCPRCEHDNPDGARFCEECATPLARTCSNCGAALSATAKFCHGCAHPVAVGTGRPSRTPDSYKALMIHCATPMNRFKMSRGVLRIESWLVP